jgi:hypothetical protein
MFTSPFRALLFRNALLPLAVLTVASAIGLSAHVVKSVAVPEVTAFVSSPTGNADAPLPVLWQSTNPPLTIDTGLRVACFYVANSTAPDPADRDWPRITSVGFELPGSPAGFSLLEPLDGDWQLVEGVQRSLGPGRVVTLDLAIVTRVNPTGRTPGSPHEPLGIPPGQAAVRRSGMRFCVSGPFPAALPDLRTTVPAGTEMPTTIEGLINGVVVGFHGVAGEHQGVDAGIWDAVTPNTRPIPMYQ